MVGAHDAGERAHDVVVDEIADLRVIGQADVEGRIEDLQEVPELVGRRLGAEGRIRLGVLGVDVALVGEGDRIESEVDMLLRLVEPRGPMVARRLLPVASAARRPDVGGVVQADRRRDRAFLEEPLLREPLGRRRRQKHDVDEAGAGHLADRLEVRRPRS